MTDRLPPPDTPQPAPAIPTSESAAVPLPSMEVRYWKSNQPLWNLGVVPADVKVDGKSVPHPGRSSAVFVVHGIGRRQWTETAAMLRSGFENALEEISEWHVDEKTKNPNFLPPGAQVIPLDQIPPPFVCDGFWSNYQDIEATFQEVWARFAPRERQFFAYLWNLRASVLGTYFWFLGQQVRLLWKNIKLGRWPEVAFIYLPLQVVGFSALTLALVRYRVLYREFLIDVRMYLAPRGAVERAIVGRIEHRVARAFMQLIGLNLEFRPLLPCDCLEASGVRITFDRVVWVAHSLGTVISFNVLSRLFHCAGELERSGDDVQKAGVQRFRECLRRFVTLGSPLNKVAFLFPDALHPWPADRKRRALLQGGDAEQREADDTEWWVNFYHVLDPVSGPILNDRLCGNDKPPHNFHVQSKLAWVGDFLLPGLAHVEYWKDHKTLRYILGRTFGRAFLYDQEYVPWSPWVKKILGRLGLVAWASILLGGIGVIAVWVLVELGLVSWSDLLDFAKNLLDSAKKKPQ